MINETAQPETNAPTQQVSPNNDLLKRKTHKYDDDGCCINCGFDGASHSWDMRSLRLEIGDDEWLYRKKSGEFDWAEHCGRH